MVTLPRRTGVLALMVIAVMSATAISAATHSEWSPYFELLQAQEDEIWSGECVTGSCESAHHKHHQPNSVDYTSVEQLPLNWRDVATHNDRVRALHQKVSRISEAALEKRKHQTSSSYVPPTHEGKTKACRDCELAGEALYLLAQNMSVFNETAGALLRDECVHLFANDTSVIPLCEEVAVTLVKLLSEGANSLMEWQVDFKEVFCADVLRYCLKPCCREPYAPEQVRLSFATPQGVGENVTMYVMWVTLEQTPGVVVEWWETAVDPNATTKSSAVATWDTYTHGGWIGVLHTATMTSLLPSTNYSYHVGSTQFGWSQLFTFQTLPLDVGSPSRPLRVAGIADMGWGPEAMPTIQALIELGYQNAIDVVVHPGDIGYMDGNQYWWDVFGREMEPLTSRVPYMTTIGNHEIIFWNGTTYKKRWAMPKPGDGAPDDATYYQFSTGPVTFMMLDTETVLNTADLDAVQMNWATAQMRKARDAGQFLFAAHHRPFYCSTDAVDCDTFGEVLRSQAEEAYRNYSVGVVMCGHVHNYERTYPVFNNVTVATNYIDPPAPFYLINGAAGNREGQASFERDARPWSVIRTEDVGYALMNFTRSDGVDTMSLQFIQSSTGAVVDALTLTKSATSSKRP